MVRTTRWPIAVLITAATAISYLDRQTLPVAIKAVECDIPVADNQFGQLNALFLVAYARCMWGVAGWLTSWASRRGFLLIMIWWSLACASHGLAQGFLMLAASRLMLGLAEGGGFPAGVKVVAEWFPLRERSTAMGMLNGGSAVGAIVAPMAIAFVLSYLRWPWVFYLSGAVGLFWSIWWLWDYFSPGPAPAAFGRRAGGNPRGARFHRARAVERFLVVVAGHAAGLGDGVGKGAGRCRLVHLRRVAAQVSDGHARLRYPAGGLLRLDPLCRIGRGQLPRRLVLQPVVAQGVLAELLPQGGAGGQRRR